MRTSKCGRLLNVRRFTLNDQSFRSVFLWFVRDQIAGEELEHAFGCSDHGRHVQPNVQRAADQSLVADLVTSQSDCDHRPEDGNRLDDSFGKAPTAGLDDSAFDGSHLCFDQSTAATILATVLAWLRCAPGWFCLFSQFSLRRFYFRVVPAAQVAGGVC